MKTASASTSISFQLPGVRGIGRVLLLIGFAFAVMADPVSSVAYTIEASLRSLHGHLGLLLATQLIVLAICWSTSITGSWLAGSRLAAGRRRRRRARSEPAGCSCRSER
jgi:hypothetical protein